MKKICFTILFAVMSTSLFAQAGVQVGIRLNPELTWLINKSDADAGDELDFKSHFSYLSFGVGALFNANNNFGLGIDVLFSREGQAFKGIWSPTPDSDVYSAIVATQLFLNDTVISGDYEALAELNYVKLPLMLSLTSDNTRPFFVNLLVGPQLNFLQGVAQEVDGKDFEYPKTDITPKDLYRPVTINGILAVGGSYNLASHLVLSAKFRFDYGFTDVEKKDVMVSYDGADPVRFYSITRKPSQNLTGGLMVGLDFKL